MPTSIPSGRKRKASRSQADSSSAKRSRTATDRSLIEDLELPVVSDPILDRYRARQLGEVSSSVQAQSLVQRPQDGGVDEGPLTTGSHTSHVMTFSHMQASGHASIHNGNINGPVTNNYVQRAPSPAYDPTQGNKHWLVRRVPERLFTGQGDILDEMNSRLTGNETFGTSKHYVLSGMGGVGKSEIALQFADNNRQKYWGVFWIDCSTHEKARRGFGSIARRCGWESDVGEAPLEVVVCELSNSRFPWLLVLDNCDDPEIDFGEFIPNTPVGTVLVTTRLEEVRRQYAAAGSRVIEGLGESYAVELLFKASGNTIPWSAAEIVDAKDIVRQLGWHTLAVTVAASLIKDRYTVREYSTVLQAKFNELLRMRRRQAKSTYETIEATFEISAQRLLDSGQECDRYALELLSVLAFLDRTDVPEEIFTRAWKWGASNRERFNNHATEAIDFDIRALSTWHFKFALSFAWAKASDLNLFSQARARLHELSLISWMRKSDGTSSVSMHPVLHSWARNRLPEAERSQTWQIVAATLALSAEGHCDWREQTFQLQAHLEMCFDALQVDPQAGPTSRVFNCQTLNLFWWQLYRADSGHIVPILAALQCWVSAAISGRSDKFLDATNAHVLAMQAATLTKSGQHMNACIIQQKVVHIYERNHEQHHEQLQRAKISLAQILFQMERYDDAAQALEGLQEVNSELPRAHTLRLQVLETLADVYFGLHDAEKAAALLEEVVEARKGAPDRDIIGDMCAQHGLAIAYHKLGHLPKSIRLLEEISETGSKIYVPGQHDRWRSAVLLAQCYTENGQLTNARQLLESMLPYLNQQVPDGQYCLYITTETDLLVREGNIDHAKSLQEQLVERNKITLPHASRDRYTQEHRLIAYLIGTSSHVEARLRFGLLQQNQDLLCEQDRRRLFKLENLLVDLENYIAFKYEDEGRVDLAIELMETVVQSRRRLLYRQHRKRIASEYGLLLCYLKAKFTTRARQQLKSISVDVDSLEPDYRAGLVLCEKGVVALQYQLALVHLKVKEGLPLAILMLEKIVEAHSRLSSPENGDRWASAIRLAHCYAIDGDPEKVRRLMERTRLPPLNRTFLCKYYDWNRLDGLDLAIQRQEEVAEPESHGPLLKIGERYTSMCRAVFEHLLNSEYEKAKELMENVRLSPLHRAFI